MRELLMNTKEKVMSLKDIQKQVDDWINLHKEGYWPPFEMFTHLEQEAGELGREISHIHGHEKKKKGHKTKGLGGEIADMLFSLFCIANFHGIYDLNKAFQRMMKQKQQGRDKDRFKKREEEKNV